MSRVRDWAKLDENWANTKKIRKLTRRFGPAPAAYWALLIATSYRDSHHEDNPWGRIDCTLQDFADALNDRHDRTLMWEAMIDVKLIKIKGGDWRSDIESDVVVEVVNFSEWQWPKGSSAKRQAEQRERKKVADLQENTTTCHANTTTRHDCVTQTETQNETQIENKELTTMSQTVVRDAVRKKPSPAETLEKISNCKQRIGSNTHLVEQLCDMVAERNKSGRVRESRLLRELWQPIAEIADESTSSQLAYGLAAALKSGVPNANYVKKAAGGYMATRVPQNVKQVRLSTTTDDEWDKALGGIA